MLHVTMLLLSRFNHLLSFRASRAKGLPFSGLDFDKDLKGPHDYMVICEHLDLAKISHACSN